MKATKWDIILILVLFTLTLWSFNASSYFNLAGETALLYIDGNLIYKIDLTTDKDYKIPVPYGTANISVKSGKLYIKDSPCPRKICMHQSPIYKEGDSLICVPNKMIIKIDEKNEKKLDTITK